MSIIRFSIIATILSAAAFGQTISTTPNLSLPLIPDGYQNWGVPYRQAQNILDSSANTYKGSWSGSTVYTVGQFVSFSGSIYISTLANNINQTPSSGVGWVQFTSGSSGGAVSSVFGRTGDVTAAIGDYSVSQVSGAASSASPVFTGLINGSGASNLLLPFVSSAPTATGGLFFNTALGEYEGYAGGPWVFPWVAPGGGTTGNCAIFLSPYNLGSQPCGGGSGGGNTTSTALTPNSITMANGANSIVNSGLSDNGSTLSYSGNGVLASEGAVLGGSSSKDALYANLVTHRWVMNNNNAGALSIPGVGTPGTSGHIAAYAANGIDLVDGGPISGGGGGGSAGTAGQLNMVGTVAGTFAASHVTDNGTNVTSTEPMFAPSFTGNVNGTFYVAAYQASGTHTQYDMARQAADAYAIANTNTGSLLILLPGLNRTCDAAPLPNPAGSWATTSIIGYGSAVSIIQKQTNCGTSAATFSHPASITGLLSRGWYQGFEIDAAHIDTAACNTYGYALTTFIDVTCANAQGTDHEWEFGSTAANNTGWMDNIYGYNIRVLDNVGGGKGAIVGLTWTGTTLTAGTITNPGTKNYTQSYIKGTLIGPGLASCTTVPTLTIQVSDVSSTTFPNLPPTIYGVPNGVTITNGGNCTNTSQLYVLVQDEYTTGVTSGFKFTNMADSAMYDVEALGTYTNGEFISNITSNNGWINEHPFTNDTYEIVDQGSANKHVNTEFDSPGYYAAVLDGQEGSFVNPSISWDGNAYLGSSGYWARHATTDIHQITGWTIVNSMCTEGSDANTNPYFNIVTAANGLPISPTNLMPTGLTLNNVQICDGSLNFINNLANGVKSTDDLTNYSWLNGGGLWMTNTPTLANGTSVSPSMGIHSDYNDSMIFARNTTGGGAADIDGVGIDSLGGLSLSVPIHGDVMATALASPGAPTLGTGGTAGSTSYTYVCTAIGGAGGQTLAVNPATVTTGNATLSSTNYNTISCPFVEGFKSFTVYRRTNGSSLGLGAIGQLTKPNFEHGVPVRDIGQAAGVAEPTINTTGIVSTSQLKVSGSGIPIATGVTANTDLAGSITLSSGTGTYSFTSTHLTAPIVVCTDTSATPTVVGCHATTTTITANGTGSDVINYVVIGRT